MIENGIFLVIICDYSEHSLKLIVYVRVIHHLVEIFISPSSFLLKKRKRGAGDIV